MEMKDILDKLKKGSIFIITIDGNSITEEDIYRTSDRYSIKCPAWDRSCNRIVFLEQAKLVSGNDLWFSIKILDRNLDSTDPNFITPIYEKQGITLSQLDWAVQNSLV